MNISIGNQVILKKECMDEGDENVIFLATEDFDEGALVVASNLKMSIKPTYRFSANHIDEAATIQVNR